MQDDDPADLDGDGEFDAIDLMILEEGEKKSECGNNGCCVAFLTFGASIMAISWGLSKIC
jgi:hypothetical protein